jgi:hypothetical protein
MERRQNKTKNLRLHFFIIFLHAAAAGGGAGVARSEQCSGLRRATAGRMNVLMLVSDSMVDPASQQCNKAACECVASFEALLFNFFTTGCNSLLPPRMLFGF